MTVVREFHEAFGLDINEEPNYELILLREALISEEYGEVMDELDEFFHSPDANYVTNPSREKLLKELCDLRYVIEGTAVSLGMDIDGAYEEVHRSNMSKLGSDGKPVLREDGKALKGPNYSPADMAPFV